MKDISMKNKIVLILLILLIIAGTITLFVVGFKKTTEYGAKTRLEIYIPNDYNEDDILDIANKHFSTNEILFEEIKQVSGTTGTKVNVIGIRINNYSEEELTNFKTEISEKYNLKEDELELHEIELPVTRIRTAVAPYVFPVILSTIISLVYIFIKNLKSENKWKNIIKILSALILVLGAYFSLILITRLPFGAYTMPVALAIYIITLIVTVNNIKE